MATIGMLILTRTMLQLLVLGFYSAYVFCWSWFNQIIQLGLWHAPLSLMLAVYDFDCLNGRLWDTRSGQIVRTLETKSSVTSAEVTEDGRYITTADGTSVKFWDANQ